MRRAGRALPRAAAWEGRNPPPAGPGRGRGAAQVATERGRGDVQRLYDELKQKFGYLGAVNHDTVGTLDLYRILQDSRKPDDFRLGLQAMNLFYNFGVKLRHRELATRLLAAAMTCRVESEAVELIKLYGTWLEHPPDTALVYAVMGHFLDSGKPLIVREIARAVREDWRMVVEPPLYILAIEAMLKLPENPLGEALELHADASLMGVRLPSQTHARLLDESLKAFEEALGAIGGSGEEAAADVSPIPDDALGHLQTALLVADRLASDGHLRGGASAATLCSVSWLFWHLGSLCESARAPLLAKGDPLGARVFLGSDWVRTLEAAMDNFGCHWGFSARLPRGFFHSLEVSKNPEAARLARAARARFGRFYPGS